MGATIPVACIWAPKIFFGGLRQKKVNVWAQAGHTGSRNPFDGYWNRLDLLAIYCLKVERTFGGGARRSSDLRGGT